jgi:hydrogenase maturation protease
MKPRLVIGLGNPLMGDDGVGCVVAERLAKDPRLPADVEVICGGSDLLRSAAQIEGRSSVLVVDALQDGASPGSVAVFAGSCSGLEERQPHAHRLAAAQAIGLLQITTPARFVLLAVSVASAAIGSGLSSAVAARVPAILDRVLQELCRQPDELA